MRLHTLILATCICFLLPIFSYSQNREKHLNSIFYILPPKVDSVLVSTLNSKSVSGIFIYAALEKGKDGYTVYISEVLKRDDKNISYFVAARTSRKILLSNKLEIPVFFEDYDLDFIDPNYSYDRNGYLTRSSGSFVRHGFYIEFNLNDQITRISGKL